MVSVGCIQIQEFKLSTRLKLETIFLLAMDKCANASYTVLYKKADLEKFGMIQIFFTIPIRVSYS